EAYLRTWGWSQYISTWYLYFRKINFPSDPEIHGRWEWAGIYYGEKF
ncbi:MAG: tetratricopeptide repeat protein, partial [Treponema sp.]|nr:tetratricopeptide repeat protein [Treponema sp.]